MTRPRPASPKRKLGRPTKLTPDVQARITQAIRLGATYELAANYGGIAYDTFNHWMQRGRAGDGQIYVDFFHAVKEAESAGALALLARIEAAAAEYWQAAAWKLERRYPQWYGRRDRLQVDDWRAQLIADIRAGLIDYATVAQAFDRSLADELFVQAGVPVTEEKVVDDDRPGA